MSRQQAIIPLLQNLESTLRTLDMWSDVAPTPEALASTQPFAIDTLAFEQWLQYIFIPKINLMLENNLPLPDKIALAPMAEQVYLSETKDCSALIEILAVIDQTLTS